MENKVGNAPIYILADDILRWSVVEQLYDGHVGETGTGRGEGQSFQLRYRFAILLARPDTIRAPKVWNSDGSRYTSACHNDSLLGGSQLQQTPRA